MVDKKIIGIGFGVFTILLMVAIFDNDPDSNDDAVRFLLEQQSKQEQLSEIETDNIFFSSDSTALDKFLDENGIPVTEQLTIETAVVLFDSQLNKVKSSTFIDIPLINSLITSKGLVIDKGAVQVGFFGITSQANDIKIEADVEIWLNKDKIAERKIFKNFDGDVVKSNSLKVDTSVKREFESDDNYTFQLTDEGEKWEDGSTNYFRVIITSVTAETQSGKIFSWHGDFFAYVLEMTVDESKVSVVDEENNIQAIFKSDGEILRCWQMATISTIRGFTTLAPRDLPTVEVFVNGKSISGVDNESIQLKTPIGSDGRAGTGIRTECTDRINNIPRFQEITIKVGAIRGQPSEEFKIVSPKSEVEYIITCLSKNPGSTQPSTLPCTSNFGWSET